VATILTPSEDNVRRAADAVLRGELVGMPTETVYGLAANAFDASAVARIFAAKDRPSFDPLIVHVVRPAGPLEREVLSGLEDEGIVEVSRLPQLARERADVLLRRFWPGALTLILPRGRKIPDLVTSGLDTVAIRMPSHPTTAAHVVQELGDRIGIVLDGGASIVGVESTVVAIAQDGTLALLRPGGISVEAIEATASVRLAKTAVTAAPGVPAASPGMSAVHYAPRTPLHLLPGPESLPRDATCVGLIGVFASQADAADTVAKIEKRYGVPVVIRALTERGDLEEAARNLFTLLRELDAGDVSLIIAAPPGGNEGLALAIADRLRRAAR